ncbi:GRAM domain-containing protein 2B-like isoform X2 [Uloborus diversus]|nr:GRAM domain-containing protein 2B-like isoform X2 [Uloborus diversus]XP_054709971.1 GRAM domain-containing protein 2B-like isoform X2 [Uloborus diversus]
MPSVSLTSSSSTSLQHRSRLLRLQDRRFRHRFPEVPQDEKLLNYFSCALVSDILLQGHLFITQNYFAFYSNIFGHKTKILINVSDVVKVTKEKIAKFIPNAVGVYTDSEKYVFGSMLSRDSAFRIIQQTWIQSTDPGLGLPDDSDSEVSPAIMLLADEDSSVSSGLSSHLLTDEMPASASDPAATPEVEALGRMGEMPPTFIKSPAPSKPLPSRCKLDYFKGYVYKVEDMVKELSQLSRISLIFMFSTFLLVLLFLSTAVLLYRIHLLHQKLLAKDEVFVSNIPRLGEFSDIVPSEFSIVVSNLEERIRSLAEVRITLEKLLAMASKFQVPNR